MVHGVRGHGRRGSAAAATAASAGCARLACCLLYFLISLLSTPPISPQILSKMSRVLGVTLKKNPSKK